MKTNFLSRLPDKTIFSLFKYILRENDTFFALNNNTNFPKIERNDDKYSLSFGFLKITFNDYEILTNNIFGEYTFKNEKKRLDEYNETYKNKMKKGFGNDYINAQFRYEKIKLYEKELAKK